MTISNAESQQRAEAREAILAAIIERAPNQNAEGLRSLAEAYAKVVSPSSS